MEAACSNDRARLPWWLRVTLTDPARLPKRSDSAAVFSRGRCRLGSSSVAIREKPNSGKCLSEELSPGVPQRFDFPPTRELEFETAIRNRRPAPGIWQEQCKLTDCSSPPMIMFILIIKFINNIWDLFPPDYLLTTSWMMTTDNWLIHLEDTDLAM